MKRLLALLLACTLMLTACAQDAGVGVNAPSETQETLSVAEEISEIIENADEDEVVTAVTTKETNESTEMIKDSGEDIDLSKFTDLSDPALLQYMTDEIYADIDASFSSEDFIVEEVQAVYISKEYLDELAYNSQANIFFGYTLDEVESQMDGQKYIFTLENGETVVKPFEEYDDTFDKVVRNVAIGTGVILICVTVSVVSGGVGAPAVAMVFAASAKTATVMALSSAAIGGVTTAAVTGYQTGDMEQALKAGALQASKDYAVGAIFGAVTGGITEVITLRKAAKAAESAETVAEASKTTETVAEVANDIPTPRQSELDVLAKYGGDEQMSFLNGKEVPWGTQNATRPDVVRTVGGKLEAIEVKNYTLTSYNSRQGLYKKLSEQVASRCNNLPEGSLQRIVLDCRGRGYSQELIEEVIANIQASCTSYPNIPVDILL